MGLPDLHCVPPVWALLYLEVAFVPGIRLLPFRFSIRSDQKNVAITAPRISAPRRGGAAHTALQGNSRHPQ